MEQTEAGASFWESFYRPHPLVFVLLVFLGLDLEFVVHYYYGITIVYTQFFYLIIVVAGLWYGRKAVWVALLFGSLHVAVTYSMTGLLSPDALVRAVVMLIVAFVVGTIVEQKRDYYDQVSEKNRELSEANRKLHALNTHPEESGKAGRIANQNSSPGSPGTEIK
jgi:K+-sensing histidine kinase KdpD